jgi:hypothetical protein
MLAAIVSLLPGGSLDGRLPSRIKHGQGVGAEHEIKITAQWRIIRTLTQSHTRHLFTRHLQHVGRQIHAGDLGVGKMFLQAFQVPAGATAHLQNAARWLQVQQRPEDGFSTKQKAPTSRVIQTRMKGVVALESGLGLGSGHGSTSAKWVLP